MYHMSKQIRVTFNKIIGLVFYSKMKSYSYVREEEYASFGPRQRRNFNQRRKDALTTKVNVSFDISKMLPSI
jgi:hypothetical protein